MMIFIVVMDVLKYGFGIDPVRRLDRRVRRRRLARETKRRAPSMIRFIYVNPPPVVVTKADRD